MPCPPIYDANTKHMHVKSKPKSSNKQTNAGTEHWQSERTQNAVRDDANC